MLSNLPIPYDLCVGDPISCLLTVGCGVNGVLNEMNENSSSRFQPGKPSFEALLHYTWHVSRGRCTRWRCSTAASRTCSWARSARTCWPPWSGERGGWRGGPCRGPAVSPELHCSLGTDHNLSPLYSGRASLHSGGDSVSTNMGTLISAINQNIRI